MQAPEALKKRGFEASIIFDVGANVGGTVAAERECFPDAAIFAFEPVSATFLTLKNRHGDDRHTYLFQEALSDHCGNSVMRAVPGGLVNRFMSRALPGIPTEDVIVETGDRFCRDHDIKHIDFLKIDTEGSDLKVLHGFDELISSKKIKFIQVECGIHPDNGLHVSFERFNAALGAKGYCLYNFFDVRRHPKQRGALRGIWFCNALFVAQ
ncbi:FkbM family methyltransferase [Methylobrevis albus]|uniref:FkbM family methyltransferase n=1 Tax=Methylobrevis albus TaxID=2793297 RepID=A0A931I2B4_9HYPH|nr:FkbM family methyltransferase [Methylobrevis albus]MBH0238124.1 FkbM family methyltransferase [Methylobrevis albus]